MLPTLQIGDRIIVDKLSYRFHDPHRGDIVVFARPPLEDQAYADLVKRVIGLPGETISSKNGAIYINGNRLAEPWLPPGSQSYTGPLSGGDSHPEFDLPGPVKIPPGEYYVMGDNRKDSEDSRFFGPIPRSLIVGRAGGRGLAARPHQGPLDRRRGERAGVGGVASLPGATRPPEP